jgi:hypothetical protein
MLLTRQRIRAAGLVAVLVTVALGLPEGGLGAPRREPRRPATPAPSPPPAMTDKGPDQVMLQSITTKRDPVPFGHAAHVAYPGIEGCATCHHNEAAGHVTRCTGCHEGRDRGREAFHGLCKGCHKRVADAAAPSPSRAPTNCTGGGCHGHLVLSAAGGEQPAVRFDHAAHRLGRAETCARCHHADPPDEAPKACASCHNPGEDLKFAFHELCIKCHVERAGGRPGAPSTKCAFCHVGPG